MAKNKKKTGNKLYYYIGILFFLNAIIHRIWLSPNAIIANGDWGYLFPETLKNTQWASWVSSIAIENPFGTPNFLPLRYLITTLQGAIIQLGYTQQVADMVIFFIPMLIIGPIGIYLLLIRLTKSEFSSFIGSLFYLFNGYILVWASAGYPLVYVYYIAPLLFYQFDVYLFTPNFKTGLFFILFLSIAIFFDLRLAVLICLFLLAYILYVYSIKQFSITRFIPKQKIIFLFILFFIFIGMNFYLFTFSLSRNIQEALSTAITSRVLIKPGYFFLPNALTTFYPFWTGGQPTMFFMQVIPWYFWVLPPYVFISIIFIRKEKRILFFFISALLLIFLGKGPTPPLENLYEWAYYHLPIFDFFRESSKFWQLLLLTFSILIAFGIKYTFSYIDSFISHPFIKLSIKSLIILPLLFIICVTANPALTTEIGPGYISYKIPTEYSDINKFIKSKKSFFRILQLPTYSRFLTYSDIHPRITINQLPTQFQTLSPYILRLFAIQYMLVPTDPYFEVFPGNSSREVYLDIVQRNAERFKVFDSLVLYKNPLLSVPHIYTSFYLNSISGSFTNIDRVFEHIVDKNADFYLRDEIPNNTLTIPNMQNHTKEEVTVVSCKTCLDYVASDSARFDAFQSENSFYAISVNRYGLSQAVLKVDNNELPLEEDTNRYYTGDVLEKKIHEVFLTFVRLNLSLDQGSREYILKKKNESIVVAKDNLKPNTSYKLSFDYVIPKNVKHTVILRQNTDFYFQYQQGKPGGPAWNAFNGVLVNDGNWHASEMTFTTLLHPTQVLLNFIVPHDGVNIKVKNITLIANNKPEIYFLRTFQLGNESKQSPRLIFQQINPTKYIVQVKDAKEPFFLIFAEQYNKYWQAAISENTKDLEKLSKIQVTDTVSEVQAKNSLDLAGLFTDTKNSKVINHHFKINGYANAWYVDKKGSYKIEITFLPQKEFVLSLLVSFLFFSTCIIILSVLVYASLFSRSKR